LSAPLLLLFGSGSAALLTLIIRRQPRASATLSAVITLVIALFIWLVPADEPFQILGLPMKVQNSLSMLGRELAIGLGNRAPITFLYLASALLFGGSWLVGISTSFLPIAHMSLAMVACSLMVDPFLFAAVFLELAAMGAVLILSPPGQPVNRGAVQLLMMFTMAMMAILATGWLLENAGVTSANPELIQRVIALVGLGFAILLTVPPFHIWLPTSAKRAHPYGLTFVLVVLQTAGLFFLLRFLDTYAWLRDHSVLMGAIRTIGLLMITAGALFALAQESLSLTVMYLLLADFGIALISVGAGQFELALSATTFRVFALTLWSMGWSATINQERKPIASTAAFIGTLSLAGFPLTAGFPARWGLMNSVDSTTAALVLLSMLIGIVAVIARIFPSLRSVFRSERWSVDEAFMLAGIAACIALGLAPGLISGWIRSALEGFPNLIAS
jgi:formate hydrogenlyase subunit 3/multisubunit Na+/H+ antiporter MnhD subunit